MRVEHIRPFAEASIEVCGVVLGTKPQRGELGVRPHLETSRQISVVCAIGGDVRGHVMLGMSVRAASAIAARMIGQPIVTFDALAASAIAEFTNMVGGHCLTLFEAEGYECSLSPPTVIRGVRTPISESIGPAIAIVLVLPELGEIEVQVSLGAMEAAA